MRTSRLHTSRRGEHGYPLLFFYANSMWLKSVLFGGSLLGGGIALYLLWNRLNADSSPDSTAGYILAFAGIACLLLAMFRYSLVRRARKRVIGQLNASLNWHMCFGLVGLFLLFLHSFGNFNPRTGTYALYGMIALVICGVVGKVLDRALPRLIAKEVHKALTGSGEDRIERISRKLQAVTQDSERARQQANLSLAGILYGGASQPGLSERENQPLSMVGLSLPPSWDLAYITLEETPQELQRRELTLTDDLPQGKGAQNHIAEIRSVQRALRKEQYYRYVLRYWRVLHILLALVTLGLTIWHIVYALQLLIPVWLGH